MIVDNNAPYLELITSEYATKYKYNKYVEAFLKMLGPTWENLASFDSLFNLEAASGEQLDVLGQLVGISRVLPISNPNIDPILNDDAYRTIIKAKIMANRWDGTTKGLQYIIEETFPDLAYLIIDNQDMSYSITIYDTDYDEQLVELLFEGYILPKPAGIKVNYTIVDSVLFGFDADTVSIQGWDLGKWNTI